MHDVADSSLDDMEVLAEKITVLSGVDVQLVFREAGQYGSVVATMQDLQRSSWGGKDDPGLTLAQRIIIIMLTTTNTTTTELQRRRTLQGRHGRKTEQKWIGRRATHIIHSLEKLRLSEEIAQRHEEYVSHHRQLTLAILEGRQPQFIVVDERDCEDIWDQIMRGRHTLECEPANTEVTRDEQTDSRHLSESLAILEGSDAEHFIVREEGVTRADLHNWSSALEILEGRRPPPPAELIRI
ncbi:hypothetical protein CPB85DRAFT_1441772 [Mucidula mucida]|nr:hypothetical protein CPB85DRAFT_1441772 [Mucidula mucida]